MTKTTLNEFDTPKHFLAEAINTSCYALNCVTLGPELKETHHEL
jgi:hypothetical protein